MLLTGANVHDSTQLQPLVEAIPPVRGKRGLPRRRPEMVQGDWAGPDLMDTSIAWTV